MGKMEASVTYGAARSTRRQELYKQMKHAGMAIHEAATSTQPGKMVASGSTPLPLLTMLQDLITCQGQAPHCSYVQERQMKLTFRAATCCHGLHPGLARGPEQAETIAEVVAGLLLHVCGYGKSSVGERASTAVKTQADEAHFLVATLVSRRMAALLEMFTPFLNNTTVRTAVNHLAVGMGGFKSEESDMAQDAASMLPLVNTFITAFLPHCNKAFSGASTDLEQSMAPHGKAIGDVLVLAIKTIESAMEVTLRFEVQGAAELSRDYHMLTKLSTSVDCVCLMTPTFLSIPQISSLLHSILHLEVVLGMSIGEDMQQSPMLQQLLLHAESMVKALHIFLLVDGQAGMGQHRTAGTELAMLVPDLVSLLVLVKSTLKACCLPQEGHAKLVMSMLLAPTGPGLAKLNLLQILWELLHIRPGISVIGPRVQEIFTVCLQQKEQWPQAFNYLVKHIPGKIARHPNRPNAPISWPVGVSPAEQTALDACQDKRVRIAQQALAQHQASRGTLPDAVQKDLDKKAKKRDAADLRAMLLRMAGVMLTEAGDALGCADRKELSDLVRRYQADKPLWDRQAIQPRPSSSNDHAVDEGDKAPPSWDHTTDASVPAALAQDIAAVSAPPLHGAAAQSNRLDSNLSGQSSSQPPSVKSPAGRLTAAELEAKMAETAQRIAAMKAAAKARKVVPADLSADSKAPDSSAKPQIRSMPLQTGSVPAGATDSTSPAARVLEAVVRPSLPALHRHNTHTGKQPASNHNHQQLRMPHDQQSRPSSPKHDLSHSQGDATASSHDSAHPGQPQPACSPSATGAASRDAQLAPGTFGKQQHGRTGRSAPSLPTRHQPVQTRNSAMLTSMVSNQHNYGSHKQEAQNRPASQAHLDPSSWHVVDWLNGSSTAAAACDGAVLQPNGSKHCQPAANMQVQGQQHGNYRSGSQPNMRSCANAAMSVTAMWMSVLNSHVPLILSQGAPTAMEIDSNPKSAVPNAHAPPDEHKTTDTQAAKTMRRMASAASAQSTGIASTAFCGPTASHMTSKWAQTAGSPTSRDCATLMDIDAPSLSPALISHKQCHQTPFGEPPQAAFGHGHCDGLQWHKLHLQVPAVHGPSDSAVSANCAMMHADDQSVAMDTNDDMQRRT